MELDIKLFFAPRANGHRLSITEIANIVASVIIKLKTKKS